MVTSVAMFIGGGYEDCRLSGCEPIYFGAKSSALMMDAVGSSETSVHLHETTWCHIP